jgi:hypothetical protein
MSYQRSIRLSCHPVPLGRTRRPPEVATFVLAYIKVTTGEDVLTSRTTPRSAATARATRPASLPTSRPPSTPTARRTPRLACSSRRSRRCSKSCRYRIRVRVQQFRRQLKPAASPGRLPPGPGKDANENDHQIESGAREQARRPPGNLPTPARCQSRRGNGNDWARSEQEQASSSRGDPRDSLPGARSPTRVPP